ncbi:MAG: hypothetical protein IH876_06820 [Gemmatimonadetes bacterium]|nr:hypothetical protein [Gemmatimonadota bacterium]
MPATPKLSRKFYDTFGEDVVNELVDWFNHMDATYRADLRDMNELNFVRFDATLQQRLAEADARWERRFAEFSSKWERRWAEFTSEWERRFAEQDIKWERRFAESEAKWERQFAALSERMAAFEARIIKWMFVMWIGTIGTLIALAKF